jgi:hypothetical protein
MAAAASSAAGAVPLLQNGRFTDPGDGVPRGWRVEAWNRDLSDVAVEPGTDGGRAVRIVSRSWRKSASSC